MKRFRQFLRTQWLLIVLVSLGAMIGLYQLDNLPAEMWGDAIAHYTLASAVRHGLLFYNFRFGGDGPIYTYLVVTVSWFIGLSFYTLKLTSVFIYLAFIAFIYLLALELFQKKELAFLTGFLATVSFWSVVFARQPHARMLVPLFITSTLYYALKRRTLLSGLLLGLGMYTQASFWAMPLILWRRYKIFLLGLLLTIPLALSFAIGGTFFTNQSYFGEKLATSDNLPQATVFTNFEHNIAANFFSFTTKGDTGFRLNVPTSPHLDTASAFFFLTGFILLMYITIKKKQARYAEFIILPFFIIQIPSLLDIHNPLAQPNIGRMIGVIPFVYLITAYGLATTWHFVTMKFFTGQKARIIIYYGCIGYLLLVIAIANFMKYFIIYPYFLPNHNTPFARIIAQTMDRYPVQTTFLVIGSGWGQWYQPEQQAIVDSLIDYRRIIFQQPMIATANLCNIITTTHTLVIITSPTDQEIQAKIAHCSKITHASLLRSNSVDVAHVIKLN